MRNMLFAASAALAVVAAAPATAGVVDFEDLAFDGDTNTAPRNFTSPLVSGEFTFTAPADPFGLPQFNVFARNSTNNPDFGGAVLFPTRNDTGFSFARTDGAAFTFNSIDVTFAFDDQNNLFEGGTVTLTFGGTSQTVAFDNLPGFQTFDFDAAGVTSVSISGSAAFAIDNIVFDEAAAAIPEPASWAMMIAGFGLVGGAMRRVKQPSAVTA